MKKLSCLMFSLFVLPLQAQTLLGTLNEHQSNLTNLSTSNSSSSKKPAPTTTVSPSTSSGRCEEDDQTSLPLAYVTSLIQEKNAALDILHDPRAGTLSVSASNMISNCSSMIEWRIKKEDREGEITYAVEASLRKGNECSDIGCKYKVAIVENGAFKEHKEVVLKPTLKGFEQCLQESGVVKSGKVDAGAIYSAPLNEKFNDVAESGKLLFVSHGPSSAQVKAKYGKFAAIDKCDHYEAIHPKLEQLLSLEDEKRLQLDEEASKLKDCDINEYHKVADFVEKYEDYAEELGAVRDRLILEAAKNAAKAIEEGKYTEEDLRILADFEKYIVRPKIEKANILYAELAGLSGEQQKAKNAELVMVLDQLKVLNAKPYFSAENTQRLINDGRFEDAEKLNSMRLTLSTYQTLGSKRGNLVVTPDVIVEKIENEKISFAAQLAIEKERYEVRTGQITGMSSYYTALAKRMHNNIQVRTDNYMQEIQSEYARMQPGGYCYAYYRNTQKCIADSMERIQELQNTARHYNKVDRERASEYEVKATEYAELEAEGKRYIASQDGEVVAETPEVVAIDTTRPEPRPQGQDGIYTFNFQGGSSQQPVQQQMHYPTNPQQQYTTMPYNMFQQQQSYGYQQQNPWLGQQAFGMGQQYNGGYSFNFAGSAGMNQQTYGYGQQGMQQGWGLPQQQGYWGQPYSAYTMPSMYGPPRY